MIQDPKAQNDSKSTQVQVQAAVEIEVEVKRHQDCQHENQAIDSARVNNAGVESVRTFFVFTDFPMHYEFRVSGIPLLEEGTVVEFFLELKDPKSKNIKMMEGPYRVSRRKLIYRTDKQSLIGLTQYLEWSQVA
jgi:hypothetical protein